MRMAEEFIVSRYLLTFPRQELYRTLLGEGGVRGRAQGRNTWGGP